MLKPNDQSKQFRKHRKGKIANTVKAGEKISYGYIGLKSMDAFKITSKQIEASRKAAVRKMDRKGKFWIRVFPQISITTKPIGVRMGSGKGAIDQYIARISPGRVLFEIDGVKPDIAKEALRLAAAKLPCSTKIVELIDHSIVLNSQAE